MKKKLVVQKFGGTSVGSLERIQAVAALVKKTTAEQQNVVVVSAMAGETNKLIDYAQKISKNPLPEAYDLLLASGEQVTAALTAMALCEVGVPAVPLLGFQVGIETDPLFSKARIQNIRVDTLERYLGKGVTPVIAGFQGVHRRNDHESVITTLGRGGSDTSAVAVAAALQADLCDIYTDVDGVYTADPRYVPDARRLERLSYAEMMELASLGAKVLHMRSVELAAKFNLALRVLSTFHPERGGTMMTNDFLEAPLVSAIASDAAEALLTLKVPGDQAHFPARYFRPLADSGINVDVIVKTPPDSSGLCTVNFTVPQSEGDAAKKLLAHYSAQIEKTKAVKVSIVGIGMRTHSGVAARMFEALEGANIPMHLVTTSEIKVSVLIDEQHLQAALVLLHSTFGLGKSS